MLKSRESFFPAGEETHEDYITAKQVRLGLSRPKKQLKKEAQSTREVGQQFSNDITQVEKGLKRTYQTSIEWSSAGEYGNIITNRFRAIAY